MEICDLADKEFKKAVLRDPNELQGNAERQPNEIKKKYIKK